MAFLDEVAQQGRVLRDLIEFYQGEKGEERMFSDEGVVAELAEEWG